MKNIIEKITTFLSKYWNLYAPPIISTIISCFTEWNASQMQIVNQYFGNIITLTCLFTMLKFIFFPNEKKNGFEKIATSQKYIKNMEIGKDVEGAVEETIELIETSVKGGKKIMEKVKKIFKWIISYKEQIIGLLGSVIYSIFVLYVYITDKFNWVFEYIPNTDFWNYAVRISFGLLSALFVFFSIRNQVKWVGVGSLEKAQEYLDSLSVSISEGNQLSDNAKKKISNALKIAKNHLKTYNTTLEEYKKLYNKAVEELNVFEEFKNNNLEYDEQEYQKATQNTDEIKTEIDKIQAIILSLNEKVEHYQKVLNNK